MKDSDFLKTKTDFPVGMAYVPWQKMEHIYENLDEKVAAMRAMKEHFIEGVKQKPLILHSSQGNPE